MMVSVYPKEYRLSFLLLPALCTLFAVCAMCYLLTDLTDVLDSIIKALSRNLVLQTIKETPQRRIKVETAVMRKDASKKLFCVETAVKKKTHTYSHI